MNDLTEQWKKRTLPNGAYYIKLIGGDMLPAFCNTEYILKQFQTMKGIYDGADIEVLAQVPSYEEWQEYKNANDSMFDTIKMLNKDNGKLEKENQQLKENIHSMLFTDDVVQDRYDKAKAENAQLKELLKECRDEVNPYKDLTSGKKTFKSLIAKINQALGEDK